MNAALRVRVVDGHLVLLGAERLPEGMEFELVPVADRISRPPANDDAPSLLDLLSSELPDDAFVAVLDRSRDLPRDPAL